MGINKIILIGRLGQDPESKFSTQGLQITKFSLATSEKYKGQEHTEWHNITAFGKLAEICSQYLHKGSQIFVEGKTRTSSWAGENNEKKYRTEVIISEMQMLGNKSQNNDSDRIMIQSATKSKSNNDDVPF